MHLHPQLHLFPESSLPLTCPGGFHAQLRNTQKTSSLGSCPGSRELSIMPISRWTWPFFTFHLKTLRPWMNLDAAASLPATAVASFPNICFCVTDWGEWYIRFEFVPLCICPGSAHSPSQMGYLQDTYWAQSHGWPFKWWPCPYSQYCLGFRFFRLCGLSLVNLAFFVWKSFFPKPYFSHRGCSFQSPWTPTATEWWWAAWCISGKPHSISAAHLGLSSGKGLVLGHP